MYRVLYVKSGSDHIHLAPSAFRKHGMELVTVDKLADAWLFLESQSPDLVLTDLTLPNGQGVELLSQPVPVVIITSRGNECIAAEAIKVGAVDYIVQDALNGIQQLPVAVASIIQRQRDIDPVTAERIPALFTQLRAALVPVVMATMDMQ